MKTITKFIYAVAFGLIPSVLGFLALAIGASSANAAPGDLFESDADGNIYEFTPGGTQSTFASGLNQAYALAFDSAGNLFEADAGSGNIYEFTPVAPGAPSLPD
jgi:hypothetical protein